MSRKPISLFLNCSVQMSRGEVEALNNECLAALREWDDEQAQELHEIQEAESSDAADPMNA